MALTAYSVAAALVPGRMVAQTRSVIRMRLKFPADATIARAVLRTVCIQVRRLSRGDAAASQRKRPIHAQRQLKGEYGADEQPVAARGHAIESIPANRAAIAGSLARPRAAPRRDNPWSSREDHAGRRAPPSRRYIRIRT